MTETATAKKYDQNEFQESNFGIRSKEDLKHIFNVLRNKIYSNKILAVEREYATNACDEHIESGQPDRPIEIHLPTTSNRVFSVRDFGRGLSEEDIRNTYTMYGASTKRGSSILNGQLGFGSKAAFSYADNYMIVSFCGGQKTVYEAYVDETGLGAISQVSKEDSTEPTGIEIRVNVAVHDIQNFRDTAVKLYKYFKVTPQIANLGNAKIDKPVYKLKGTTWGLREQLGHAYSNENMAVMGNIAYPLSRQVLHDNLKQSPNWSRYEQLMACPIDFFCPVGDVSIAASREALEYDKKTIRSFQTYCDTAIKEITEEFTRHISTAKDIVEAKQCYKLLVHGELKALAGVIITGGQLRWNNQVIDNYHFEIPEITHLAGDIGIEGQNDQELPSFTVRMIEPANIAAGHRSSFLNQGRNFEITDEAKVFFQNEDDKPILRVRKFLQDNPGVKKVYLFKASHCGIEDIVRESGVPRKYFVDLSTQEALTVENTRESGPHNVKHSRKVFQMTDPASGNNGADSTYWDTITIDTDQEYYYVYLDRFLPRLQQTGSSTGNGTFRNILDAYQTLTGINLRPRIIGVKVGAAERIVPTWRSLDAVIREGLTGQVQNATATIENVALRSLRQNNFILGYLETGRFDNLLNNLPTTSPMRRLYTRYRTATLETAANRNNIFDALQNIKQQLNMEFPELDRALIQTTTRVNAEMAQVLDRYPLLRFIQFGYGQQANVQFATAVANYVARIDDSTITT